MKNLIFCTQQILNYRENKGNSINNCGLKFIISVGAATVIAHPGHPKT
jgi:hypothetical protein